MSHVEIVLDGEQLFKGHLGKWRAKPPDFAKDLLKPGAKPQPVMKAIMMALSDMATAQQSGKIVANSSHVGWDVTVRTWESKI
jgi:hypothetical protein